MIKILQKITAVLHIWFCLSCVLYADEQLNGSTIVPSLAAQMALPFQDHAVLQQKIQLPVWGHTLPEAKVTVRFNGQTKTTVAKADGSWRLYLEPMDAIRLKSVNGIPEGKMMMITCEKGGQSAVSEIRDLLLGDVWICAGQSNIAGAMKRAGHPKNFPPNSINDAKYPALRHFNAKQNQWEVCSPETAVSISRVSFFFARRVQRDALVPMGLIVTAVGGSNIESWLNQKPYQTGKNYEGLLEPHVGYGIRGAIWYQGESNEKDGRAYHPKLKSLILGWRKAWNQDEFPVHFVQLPGLNESTTENPAGGDGRAEIRRAYVETLALQNTGMAVTIDIGTTGEHPPNKYDAGDRLARSVLKDVYKIDGMTSCPLYKSHEVEGSGIRVRFTDDAGKGLMIAKKATTLPEGFLPPTPTPDAKLQWLSIQAKDGSWHWADGKIEGSELIVSAEGVTEPKAVRYAYTAQPLGHLLYNKDGMPVGPFTTCGYDESPSAD
ncbi:MAG: sialate O-acetylesterase [Akkermansiaceae bacterium]